MPGLHCLILAFFTALTWTARAQLTELVPGFKATPDPSISTFQPLLADSSGDYSLGFLRLGRNHLTLSVLHVPSAVPLWSATTDHFARWAEHTHLSFNGSLILSDPRSGVFWSTHTNGDLVWLSNTSNLIIQTLNQINWQSFDFPSDTLVEGQNFTTSMALIASDGIYSMRLGSDNFGLFAKFGNSEQMYFRHGAMKAKADIIEGIPIYLVLKPGGFLGMYQNGSVPADVLPFNTFQQNVSGIHRVRIEPDGNFKGYYWTGSTWVLDYEAIPESCELPSSCGSYGLCKPGRVCSCLDNRTDYSSGGCAPPENSNFCGAYDNRFKALRRNGVELPFKDLMEYKITASYEQCESACEGNCSCWGVVYTNYSGFCYTLEYPVQTLLAVGDQGKMGYFKVREGVGKKGVGAWLGLGIGLLGVILVFAVAVGYGWQKLRRREVKEFESEVGIGPYKDLRSASFRSIELCER